VIYYFTCAYSWTHACHA